jgi:hypothetical protein
VSVTDKQPCRTAQSDTCNAGLTDEGALALMRGLIAANERMDAQHPERVARRERVEQAAYYGTTCAECSRDLGPGETVGRRRFEEDGVTIEGFGSHLIATASVCEDCCRDRPDGSGMVGSGDPVLVECSGCRRPVSMGSAEVSRWSVCSTVCRYAVRKAERRHRAAYRRYKCDQCGEVFTPARADARHCSSACRQKAYRQRSAERATQRAANVAMLREYNDRLQ